MFGSALTIARLWGIPIKLHFTFLLALPFLAFHYGVFMALGVFASIVLHEMGHSMVAMHKGCRVREILLLPIGGAARMDHMPFKPVDEILMALAGPAVSLLLFGLLVWGGAYVPLPRELVSVGNGVIAINEAQMLGVVNLILACFNLLPSFPMDGGRVVRALLMIRLGRLRATLIAARLGQTIAVLGAAYALGHLPTHFMWLVVAVFIFWAAASELRMVRFEEASRRRFNDWFVPSESAPPTDGAVDQAVVMPPPYRRGPAETTPIKPLE